MKKGFLVCTLLVLVAVTCAVPVDHRPPSQECAKECREGGPGKFEYEPGKVYEYAYEADTLTTLQGSAEEHSSLHVRANARILVYSKCEFALQLTDVSLEESDPRNYETRRRSPGHDEFKRRLESKALRFGFQDGEVTELCGDEDPWVLNVKRGVLSAFQNSMDDLETDQRVHETDIAGRCHATYTIEHQGWGSTTIKKQKDLLGCTERHGNMSALQSDVYHVNSAVQSLPVMNSTHHCTQTIKNHIVVKSYCKERHIFRPFSQQHNGAVTKTRQNLEFKRTSEITTYPEHGYMRRHSLLFDHDTSAETARGYNQAGAEDALRELCEVSKEDVRPEVPRLFSRAVLRLKELDADRIKAVYRRVDRICEGNTKGRKFFLDALPMVGTSCSVRVMSDLILDGQVTGTDAEMWITSLAFIQRPNAEMVAAMTPLLNQAEPSRNVLLGVSTLMHSYCRVNPECLREEQVRSAVQSLERRLGYKCQTHDESQTDLMVTVLKALANVGRVTTTDRLERCYVEKDNPVEVRLAAVQAFRRLPCEIERDHLLRTFSNQDEDTEVRIASYLAVMRCSTPRSIETIKIILDKEQVNQVGSFVWTHLTNLRESSDPCKAEIRQLLADATLEQKFSADARKFSRNFEGSLFSELANTGAHADANVIFSPKSYVPRSASLNLTIDLFGRSVNLFEIGGRVQGMEHFIESFFGPNGYFKDQARSKETAVEPRSSVMNSIRETFGTTSDDPTASAYLKIFGNELGYWNFRGDPTEFIEAREAFNFIEFLIKLSKEHDIEYTKSFEFLNTRYVIPTLIGFPLNLTLNGTASVNLKVGGKMDLRQLVRAPRSAEIDGHIRPSGAVELTSQMSVDAFVARTGLKMVSTLHSSTEANARLRLKNGKIFDFDIDTPRERQEIFDVQSNFYILHRDQERRQNGIERNRYESQSCTGSRLAKWTGMALCGELTYPNASLEEEGPYYPLTGPSRFTVYINKVDRNMKGYHGEMRFINNKREQTYEARISVNTPGSDVDREWTTDFNLNVPRRSLNMNLKTPFNKASIIGNIIDEDKRKSMEFSFIHDDTQRYSVAAGYNVEALSGSERYVPTFEVRRPNQQPITLRGYLLHNKRNSRVNVDLTLDQMFRRPVSLKGDLTIPSNELDIQKYSSDLSFKSEYLDTKISGYAQKRQDTYSGKGSLEYRISGRRQQKVDVYSKVDIYSTRSLYKLTTLADVQFTAFPALNSYVSWQLQHADGHLENSLALRFGEEKSDENTVKIEQLFRDDSRTAEYNKIAASLNVTHPRSNTDFRAKMEHQNNANLFKNEIDVTANGRRGFTALELRRETSRYMNIRGELRFGCDHRQYKILQSIEERQPKEYHSQTVLSCAKYGDSRIDAVYKNKNYMLNVHQEIRVEAVSPNSQPIIAMGKLEGSSKHANINGEIQYKGVTYKSNGLYEQRPNNVHHMKLSGECPKGRISAECNAKIIGDEKSVDLDARYGSRHIVGLAKYNKQQQGLQSNIDLRWDADRDENKRFQADVRYSNDFGARLGGHQHNGNFTVRYPPQNINVQGGFITQKQGHYPANGRYHTVADVTYAPGRQIQLITDLQGIYRSSQNNDMKTYIELRTPFRGYERISLNDTHKFDGRDLACHLDVTWAPRRSIKSDITATFGNQYRATWHLQTPYRSYEDLTFNVRHKGTDLSNIDSHFDAQWSRNRRLDLDVDHKMAPLYNNQNIDSKIRFKSPFENAENLEFQYRQKPVSAEKTNIHSEASWSPSKKVVVDLDHSDNAQPIPRNIKSKLTVNTPFENMRRTAVTIDHSHSPRHIKSQYAAEWDDRSRMTLDIDANHQDNYYTGRSLNGAVRFRNPFIPGFEDVSAKVNYTMGRQELKTSGEMRWGPYKKVNVDVFGKYIPHQKFGFDMNGNFSVRTPFHGYREFDIGAVQSLKSNSINGKYDVNCEHNHHSTFDFKGQAHKNAANGEFTFSSPYFKNTERIHGEASYNNGASRHNSNAEFSWAPQRKITLRNNVNMRNDRRYNFDFDGNAHFTSPFRNWESLTLTFDHKNNDREGYCHGTFQWAPSSKIAATIEAQNRNSHNKRDMFGAAQVRTPWRDYKFGRVEIAHKDNGREFNSRVTYQDPYNRKSEITSDININTPTEVEGKLKMVTPVRGYEYMALTVNGQNFPRSKVAHIIFEQDTHQKADAILRFDMPKPNNYRVFSKFSSTLQNFREDLELGGTVNLGSNYDGQTNYDYNAMAYFTNNGEKTQLNTNLRGRFSGKILADAKFTSPISGFEELDFEIGHEFVREGCNTEASFSWSPSKRIQTGYVRRGLVRDLKDLIDVRSYFRSPFRNYEDLRLNITYEHTDKHIDMAKFGVSWAPRKQIVLEGNYSLRNGNLDTGVTFSSPFRNFEELAFNAKFSPRTRNYQGSTQFSWSRTENVKFFGKVRYNNDNANANFEFTSPFDNFRDLQLKGKYNKNEYNTHEATATLRSDRHSIQLYGTIHPDLRNFQSTLKFTSPFRNFEQFIFNGNFNDRNFLTNFQWRRNAKVQLESSYGITSTNVHSMVKFTSPFRDFEELIFNVQANNRNFLTNFQWDTNSKVQLESNYEFQPNDVKVMVKFTSPFRDFEELIFNGQVNNRNFLTNFQWDRTSKVQLESNYEIGYKKASAMVKFTSPFRHFEQLIFNGNFNNNNFLTNFQWQNGRIVELRGDYMYSRNEIGGKVEFTSPFEDFRQIIAQLHHSYANGLLDSTASLQVQNHVIMSIDAKIHAQNVRDIDFTISIIQPWIEQFEPFVVKGAYKEVRPNRTFFISTQWQENKIARLEGNVNFEPTTKNFQTDLTFTSPFENFETLVFEAKYNSQVGNKEAKTSFQWENGKKVQIIGALNTDRDSVSPKLVFKSPFNNYRNVQVGGRYENGRKHELTASMSCDRHSWNFIGTFENRQWNKVQISGKITSDVPNFEVLAFEGLYEKQNNNYVSEASVQWAPTKKIEYNMALTLEPSRNIDGEVVIKTPFYGYEKMSGRVNYKRQSSGFTVTSNLEYGRNQKISIVGSASKRGDRHDVSASISTPYDSARNLGFKHHCEMKQNVYSCEVTFDFADGKQMKINTDFMDQKDHSEIHIKFSSPCPYIEDFETLVMYEVTPGKYHSNAYFQTKDYGRFEIDTTVVQDSNSYMLSTDIKTPFDGYTTNNFVINAQRRNNFYTVKATGACENKKIESYGEIDFRQGYEIKLQLDTPFENFQDLEFDATYNSKGIHIVVQYATGKKIDITINFSAPPGQYLSTVTVLTPFHNYESMKAVGMLQISNSQYRPTFEITTGNKKYRVVAEFVNRFPDFNGFMTAETPYRGYERMEVRAQLENKNGRIKPSFEAFINNKKFKIDGNFGNYGFPNYDAQLSVETPFHPYESLSFKVTNRWRQPTLTNKIEFMYRPGKKIVADTVFTSQRINNVHDVEFHLTTPFEDLRDSRFAVHHEQSNKHYNVSTSLIMENDELFDVRVGGKYFDDKEAYDVLFRNPVQPMSAFLGLERSLRVYAVVAKFTPNIRRNNPISAEYIYKNQDNRGTYKRVMNIVTVVPSRTMTFETTAESGPTRIAHKTEFCWDEANDRKASYEIVGRKTSSGFSGDIKVQHPLRDAEINAEYTGNLYEKGEGSISYKWDLRDNRKVASLVLNHEDTSSNGNLAQEISAVFKHPRLRNDVILRNKFAINPEFGSGRNTELFSSRTEFSYSSDPRKTYVWESRVMDNSRSRNDNNFTVTIAVTHPATNVDVSVFSSVARSEEAAGAILRILYLTRNGQQQNVNIRGELDVARKHAEFELRSPMTNIDLTGQCSPNENGVTVTLKGRQDNHRPIRSTLNVRYQPKHFNWAFYTNSDDESSSYNINGGWLNSTAIRIEAYHQNGGARVTDGLLTARLNQSNLFHSRVHWRPGMFNELSNKLEGEVQGISRRLTPSLSRFARSVSNELLGRYTDEARQLDYEFEPVLDEIDREVSRFASEVSRYVTSSANEMYRNNEFYIQNLDELAREITRQVNAAYVSAVSQLTAYKRQLYHEFGDYIRRVQRNVEVLRKAYSEYEDWIHHNYIFYSRQAAHEAKRYEKLAMNQLDSWQRQGRFYTKQKLHELHLIAHPYIQEAFEMYNRLQKTYDEYIGSIQRKVDDLAESVLSHPYYRKIAENIGDAYNTIRDGVSDTYRSFDLDALKHFHTGLTKTTDTLSDSYNRMMETVSDGISSTRDITNDKLEAAKQHVKDLHHQIMSSEHAAAIKDLTDRAYDKAKWAYNYYDLEGQARNVADNAHHLVRKYAKNAVSGLAKRIRDSSKMTIYDPQNGEIQLEQYLPQEWPSLDQMPNIYETEAYKKFRAVIDQYLPAGHDLSDLYYNYKPASANVLDWVPPFKAHATLVGNQHYQTFDGRHYDFAGECSYVLAHDFVDGNFTVMANYERMKSGAGVEKKSITVVSDDREFELFRDATVKMNGRPVELPIQIAETTRVIRTPHGVLIENMRGVHVECNWERDSCTVNITGWYFGKTAGLLGTYDNEPSTDFTTSDRRVVRDIDTFTASWNVRQGCRSRQNFARDVQVERESSAYQMCAEFFENDDHEFRTCYKVTSPAEYLRMCANDVQQFTHKNRASSEESRCQAAAAYVQECARQGVELDVPSSCVKCQGPDGSFYEEEKDVKVHLDTSSRRRGDVVFVVEEKPCNQRHAQSLPTIASKFDSFLAAEGITHNRFAVVGYGGPNVHREPHSHTSNGQLFGDSRSVRRAFESLVFGEDENQTPVNAFSALEFAAEYPFAAGASKTIVLVTCGGCNVGTEEMDYAEMHSLLLESDITLHVLMDYDLKTSKKSRKSKVIGIAADEAYTLNDFRDDKMIIGDRTQYGKVAPPKDMCVALAQESNGTMFDSGYLQKDAKKFVEVFARRVAQTARPSDCQVCTCLADSYQIGHSDCRPCSRPKAATIIKEQKRQETAVSKRRSGAKSRKLRRSKKNQRRRAKKTIIH